MFLLKSHTSKIRPNWESMLQFKALNASLALPLHSGPAPHLVDGAHDSDASSTSSCHVQCQNTVEPVRVSISLNPIKIIGIWPHYPLLCVRQSMPDIGFCWTIPAWARTCPHRHCAPAVKNIQLTIRFILTLLNFSLHRLLSSLHSYYWKVTRTVLYCSSWWLCHNEQSRLYISILWHLLKGAW